MIGRMIRGEDQDMEIQKKKDTDMTEGVIWKQLLWFALPLMVGIACGAYSSVCITGPLWYVMKTKLVKKQE